MCPCLRSCSRHVRHRLIPTAAQTSRQAVVELRAEHRGGDGADHRKPHRRPAALARHTLERVPGGASRIGITPQFLAGAALAIGGALVRFACFRRMGRMFTFELSLRAEHRLVTDGPYGVVRHPSYTGLFLNMLGSALVHFGAGSWSRECGWLGTVGGRRYAMVWILFRTVEVVNLLVRAEREDTLLSGQFGEAWQKWARDTSYRVIPFIF